MPRIEINSDQWFTPVEIIEGLILLFPNDKLIDVTTCDEAPDIDGLQKYIIDIFNESDWKGIDLNYILFCNPPYSKKSGGAQKFIEFLLKKFDKCIFLVNYDSWVPRLATEKNLKLGLFEKRIKFKAGGDNKESTPRHANALLVKGISALPLQLGEYNIRW